MEKRNTVEFSQEIFGKGENKMANEELNRALRESWEKHDGKTIEIKEGEPTFDAKDFIESLSYSKTQN